MILRQIPYSRLCTYTGLALNCCGSPRAVHCLSSRDITCHLSPSIRALAGQTLICSLDAGRVQPSHGIRLQALKKEWNIKQLLRLVLCSVIGEVVPNFQGYFQFDREKGLRL